MPEADPGDLLSSSTEQVLETMFFTSVEPSPATLPPAATSLCSKLSFQGESNGNFSLTLSPQAARALATNFLGVEEGGVLEEKQVGEVLCELANMICGSMLSCLKADASFELSTPVLAAPAPHGPGSGISRAFNLEDGVLDIHLELKSLR